MKLQSLRDLYVEVLKDLYNAENQITKALPRLAKAASSPELQTAFTHHLEETKQHVSRLEQIFEKLGGSPKGKRCRGMEGVLEEGAEMLETEGDAATIDAGLIIGAQKVEHYEMAGYGSARTFAEMLGEHEAADLLQKTLDEEMVADKRLTALAERIVNPDSMETQPTNQRM